MNTTTCIKNVIAIKSPIAAPADHQQLCAEVAELAKSAPPLAAQSKLEVYLGSAEHMPAVMHEIGRLREMSFRAIGEGTGKALDLDRYDQYYLHLFLWDKEQQCVAGAYRLGRTDTIMAEHGASGLITSSWFEFEQPFLDFLNPSLELGRAFVAPSHQNSIFALALLWKGISCYVAKNPQYNKLFGTVSISDDYSHLSQDLIVKYIRKSHLNNTFSNWVKPTNPYQELPREYDDISLMLTNIEQVSAKVVEAEPDGKTIPVLLRQYMKLNATLLEFNVDADFGNTLDALVLVDLHQAPAAMMKRYMGRENYHSFSQSNKQRSLELV